MAESPSQFPIPLVVQQHSVGDLQKWECLAGMVGGTQPQDTDLAEPEVEVAGILCLRAGEGAVHHQLPVDEGQEVGVCPPRSQPHQLDLIHSHLAAVSNRMGAGEKHVTVM